MDTGTGNADDVPEAPVLHNQGSMDDCTWKEAIEQDYRSWRAARKDVCFFIEHDVQVVMGEGKRAVT